MEEFFFKKKEKKEKKDIWLMDLLYIDYLQEKNIDKYRR